MLPEKIKQPEERLHKLILVSIYYGRRLIGWRLASATKVGNSYQVAIEALYPPKDQND